MPGRTSDLPYYLKRVGRKQKDHLQNDKIDLRKPKNPLNILEIAATDKENLSSKIHKKKISVNSSKSGFTKKNKKNLDNRTVTKSTNIAPNSAVKRNQSTQSTEILASDLTNDNPSENYWQNLAESCRKALETALKENVDLHNKVNELEYENSRLKSMLDEAKALVEVLTEMIEEKPEESTKENTALENTKDDVTSDSEFENMSFQ